MRWILALHIISMVAWMSGLFYLPRLFVYHTGAKDAAGNSRFKTMERKLYYMITWPAGLLTSLFGLILLFHKYDFYRHQNWMHVKLIAALLLWCFHLYCGHCLKQFKHDRNRHSEKFYRFFNEAPTVLLIIIVIAAIVKP